ncbi:MAG: hypothetical protein R2940_00555 [Syntrophotaleaceae bacterium]
MTESQGFFWERHPEAEQLMLDLLERFCSKSRTLASFQERLVRQASGRLLDWVDHLLIEDSPYLQKKLTDLGFVEEPESQQAVWCHPGTQLPPIVLTELDSPARTGAALRVDSLADFLQANGFACDIEGEPFSPYRRAWLGEEQGIVLLAVERRGSADLLPSGPTLKELRSYLSAVELWQTRPRFGDDEDRLWKEAFRRVDRMLSLVGTDLAAWVVCEVERRYWLARNRAGRLQQARQATLGLGWGNHDHHTFRSSRRHFSRLVNLFSLLGFENRERFYAGEEAGWGAQVMENSRAGLALFLDVDLAPEEVAADFSQEELPERGELGTVGLWCALHGDSIFGAGMHHLAALFDFDRLIEDLAEEGIDYMPPFSDFPYLRQAFSVAERWPVAPARLSRLAGEGLISSEQADKFLTEGAVGSHLENIQRREGYKGFNKKNVSAIIRQTDPRREG